MTIVDYSGGGQDPVHLSPPGGRDRGLGLGGSGSGSGVSDTTVPKRYHILGLTMETSHIEYFRL